MPGVVRNILVQMRGSKSTLLTSPEPFQLSARWTMLIVGDVFFGIAGSTRFKDLQLTRIACRTAW